MKNKPSFAPKNYNITTLVGSHTDAKATIYLWKDVAKELICAALYRKNQPQTALLIGKYSESSLQIRGFIDVTPFWDAKQFITEINQEWTQINNRIQRYTKMKLIGWANILPNKKAQLLHQHQIIHRSLFSLPYQISLLIDPVEQLFAIYGTDLENNLVPHGFNIVTPKR